MEEFSVLVQRGTVSHLFVLQGLLKKCDLVTIHSWLRWLVPGSALFKLLGSLGKGGEECHQFDRENIFQRIAGRRAGNHVAVIKEIVLVEELELGWVLG